MKRVLNNKKEYYEFVKTYDPMVDPRLLFKLSEERTYIIYPEDYIKWEGKWCKYLGFVTDLSKLENINSFYRIRRKLYFHRAIVKEIDLNLVSSENKIREDNSEFFNVPIKEEDNELMVMSKEMLKGIRINTFKSLFKSTSDFNNVKKEITSGNGRFSWDRFLLICDLLGFDHELKVTKNSNGIVIGEKTIRDTIKEVEDANKSSKKK